MHIGQPHVAAAEAHGEALVVDAEEVEHVGVHVVNGEFVLHDAVAVFIRGAINRSALRAASCHPQAESLGIVIAAVALGEGGATELSGENEQGRFEEAPLFQVLDEGGDGLINRAGVLFVAVLDVAVLVPAVAVSSAGRQFNETHSAFHHAAGEQTLRGKFAGVAPLFLEAVHAFRGFRLAGQVHGLGYFHLHAIGQLVIANGRLDLGRVTDACQEIAVDFPEALQFLALNLGASRRAILRMGFPGLRTDPE